MNSSSELSPTNTVVCLGKWLFIPNCFFLQELKIRDAETFCFEAVSGVLGSTFSFAFLCLVNESLLAKSVILKNC